MQKKIQSWIKSGVNNAASQKVIRDAILNRPEVQNALAKYINSLNLQGQVNKGLISEQQALELFTKAVQNFKQQINTTINNCFTNNQLDQTDLSNPINMQMALSNPNSFASQQMTDAAENIIQSIQMDMDTMEQSQQQAMQEQQAQDEQQNVQQAEAVEEAQQLDIQQQTPQEQPQQKESSLEHTGENLLKGAVIIEAIRVLDEKPETKEAEKLLEKAFHDHTGLNGTFEKAAEEKLSKEESLFSHPVPRPPKKEE